MHEYVQQPNAMMTGVEDRRREGAREEKPGCILALRRCMYVCIRITRGHTRARRRCTALNSEWKCILTLLWQFIHVLNTMDNLSIL